MANKAEENIILSYPKTAKKELPVGATRIDINDKSVHFPTGRPEEIYASEHIGFCRSALLYVDTPIQAAFSLKGTVVHSGLLLPFWTRKPDLKFDLIEIVTTRITTFYVQMATLKNGVPEIEATSEEPIETQVFTNEEIWDTDAHNSTIADVSRYKIVTVYVDNQLDQNVSVQVKLNRSNSTSKSVNLGAAFNVATVDQESRTYDPTDEGYLPYVYVEVTCAIEPTSGNLNIYIIAT